MKKLIAAIIVTLALGLQGWADEEPQAASQPAPKQTSWQGRSMSGTTWDETLPQAQERRMAGVKAIPMVETKAVGERGAMENIFTMLIHELKYSDLVGGYAVLVHSTSFRDSDHGPFVGVQGNLPFEKHFASGNYIGTCLVLGMVTLPDTNKGVAGLGLHGELVAIPFVGAAKNSTPVLRLTPGQLAAPLGWTLALICPVDQFGIGVEGSITVKTF